MRSSIVYGGHHSEDVMQLMPSNLWSHCQFNMHIKVKQAELDIEFFV